MKNEYLLRGLVYCGCGRGMAGGGRHAHTYYYRCPRRYASGVSAGSELCQEPLVHGEVVESVTWDYIMRLVKDPVEFETKLRQAQEREASAVQPKRRELEHVIALLKQTEKEADEIASVTRKVKGLVGARLQQQADEVNQRYEALTRRKSELEESLAVELSENTIVDLLHYREAVALGLENATFEDRRQWLEVLQTRVTVKNGTAIITCRLGGEPLEYRLFKLPTSASLT